MKFSFPALLKEKPKSAAEVVQKAVTAFNQLEQVTKEKQTEKALEGVAKALGYMKLWLFGDEGHDPTIENVVAVATESCQGNLLTLIVKNMKDLDFETRKDAAQVFGAIVRIRDNEQKCPGALYVQRHPEILDMLFRGYEDATIALNCGSMFRDCLRDEGLARYVLGRDIFWGFFQKIEVANFEIATDVFTIFKFFEAYMKLLQSSNYVTRRQSLKLLGELLLDRSNVKTMVKFVSELPHLIQMMKLLKDPSRSIQFEAFHVFKVFVANPSKPPLITETLVNNKEKLLKYLEEFHTERDEDEQFKEEKAVIIKEISLLSSPSAASGAQPLQRLSSPAPAAPAAPAPQPSAEPTAQQASPAAVQRSPANSAAPQQTAGSQPAGTAEASVSTAAQQMQRMDLAPSLKTVSVSRTSAEH